MVFNQVADLTIDQEEIEALSWHIRQRETAEQKIERAVEEPGGQRIRTALAGLAARRDTKPRRRRGHGRCRHAAGRSPEFDDR
jgi:hypothetical protein